MGDINEAVDNTFTRWGISARPVMDREQCGECLAISLGLGALFNENIEAERAWMKYPRKELRGTPYLAVLQGRTREVLDLVEKERGL